jgi:acyl phosphate:glycerol-3-phosphate acyltransferase
MIVNNIIIGIIAVVIGYLLGSIPFAYVFTRLATGKDIQKVSAGNIGARNTFVNIGKLAGIATGFLDIVKGFASVTIAWLLLNSPSLSHVSLSVYFILAAGLAAVAGHIWSLYIKFKGGNGLATAFGVLLFVLPWEILIAVCVTLLFLVVTRNVILSFNLGLFSTPVTAWIFMRSWVYTAYPLIIVALMLTHFGPVIVAEIHGASSSRELFNDLFRIRKNG